MGMFERNVILVPIALVVLALGLTSAAGYEGIVSCGSRQPLQSCYTSDPMYIRSGATFHIKCSGCQFRAFESNMFRQPNWNQIEILEVSDIPASQSQVMSSPFTGHRDLREIRLRNCGFKTLTPALFTNNEQVVAGLVILEVAENKELSRIDVGTFRGMAKLRNLTLAFNNIGEITSRLFEGLVALKDLNLQYNALSVLGLNIFHGLEKLETVDLTGNPMFQLNFENIVKHAPASLTRILMQDWPCATIENKVHGYLSLHFDPSKYPGVFKTKGDPKKLLRLSSYLLKEDDYWWYAQMDGIRCIRDLDMALLQHCYGKQEDLDEYCARLFTEQALLLEEQLTNTRLAWNAMLSVEGLTQSHAEIKKYTDKATASAPRLVKLANECTEMCQRDY